MRNILKNKGKNLSEEHKRNISLNAKTNPNYGMKNKKHSVESIKKRLESMKGYKHSEETKKKMRETRLKNPIKYWLGKKMSEETKKKMSLVHKGKRYLKEEYPNYGMRNKKLSEEVKTKMRKNNPHYWQGKSNPKQVETKKRLFSEGKLVSSMKGKFHTEKTKEKISKNRKGKNFGIDNPFYGKHHTIETKNLISKNNLGYKHTEEAKNKIREKSIECWKNPEYAKKVIEKTLKSLMERPTSYEQKISNLCIKYSLPFIYTGDGTFLIGHKNPDFVNKMDKIVIEVYTSYFKIRDWGSCQNYEKLRSEYFSKYGYKTLFIVDDDVNCENWENVCLNKINEVLKCEVC